MQNLVVNMIKRSWFREIKSEVEDGKEKPAVQWHCHIAGKFRGLANIKCRIKSCKNGASCVVSFP